MCDSPTYTASSAAALQDMLVPAAALEVSEGPCQEHHRSSRHCEFWHCICALLAHFRARTMVQSSALGALEGVAHRCRQEPCLQQELSPEMSKGKDGPGPPAHLHQHPACSWAKLSASYQALSPFAPSSSEAPGGGHHSSVGYWLSNHYGLNWVTPCPQQKMI